MKSIQSLSLATTALLCAAPITYAVDLTPVLVQTQSVPGDAAFSFYEPSSINTGLSNTRKVVTWGIWNGSNQFADDGIFTWQNGLLTDLLRSNDVVNSPGIGQPVVRTQPGFIDNNGNVAAPAKFGVDQDGVNYFGPNRAGLAFVNRVGGTNAPGTAQPWDPFIDVAANNNGQMAFYGRVGNANLGVWRGTNSGNLVRLAQATVTLIPGTASPITGISSQTPMVNSSGLSMINVSYGVGEEAVLIGTSDANLQVIARTNNLDVPGLPAGTKFSDVTKHSINNAGHTVIGGSWDNGSHNGTFTTARGILEPVALGGVTPVPGLPGQVFEPFIGTGLPIMSGNDKIFFTGSTDSNYSVGVFKWDNGVLSNLLLDGQAAPGTASTFQTFDNIHTDAAGNLMVLAELADDEVGLWWVPAGTTTPILQLLTGQMVDLFGNGTDIRPIDDITMAGYFGGPESGINRLLNDNGDFVVQLDFAAGVNTRPLGGLYISTVAVPEPAALAAIALGSAGLVRRRRRSF